MDKDLGMRSRRAARRSRRTLWILPRRIQVEKMERGQAIVLIALMLVLLLGMTAIAIDGGGLLFLQRDAQNAADAAALAASRYHCALDKTDPSYDPADANIAAVQLGEKAARENGFDSAVDDNGLARDVTVTVTVGVLPTGTTATGAAENYTIAEITASKPSFFAQVVYRGPLTVTVRSIAECSPAVTRDSARGLVGFGQECPLAVDRTGSSSYVGGGVSSASECRLTGNAGNSNPSQVDGQVSCENGYTIDDSKFNPDPVRQDPPPGEGTMTDPLAGLYRLADWSPTGRLGRAAALDMGCGATNSSTCYYSGTSLPSSGVLEGVYYIDGNAGWTTDREVGDRGVTIIATGQVDMGAKGFILAGTTPTPTRVQPYQLNATGYQNLVNAGWTTAELQFAREMLMPNWLLVMSTYTSGDSCAINGTNAAVLAAAKGTGFYGIIYAPNGGCGASFSDFTAAFGAIMCRAVSLSGSNIWMDWDPSVLPPIDPHISVNE